MVDVFTADDYRTAARVCRYRGLYGSADTFDGEADAIDTEVSRFEALGRAVQLLHEQAAIATDGQFFHDFGRALGDFLPSIGYELTTDDEAPNLAAVAQEPRRFTDDPGHSGSWATWQEVPEGVHYQSRDLSSLGVWVNRNGRRYFRHQGNETLSIIIDRRILDNAPFVRADHE